MSIWTAAEEMIDFLRPATEDIAEGAGGDARHDDELGVYDGGDGGQDRGGNGKGRATDREQATEPTVRTPTQFIPHIPSFANYLPHRLRAPTPLHLFLFRPLCADKPSRVQE